jgi:hypothetical protein
MLSNVVRVIGWILVAFNAIALLALALPEVHDQAISVPSLVTRYGLGLIAGVGLGLLRKWGVVI